MRDEAGTSGLPGGKDHLAPGTPVGDYVVEGFLGEGGMATVYVGRHPIIGRRVAIKAIRASLCQSVEAVERFVQEARAANEIGHDNIVDVYTFGNLPDGRCYFVMEWLKGRTLADILDHDGALPLADAVSALTQICDGLEAAHRAGIVHRDLKPQNVFFVESDSGRRSVKLLDFGIAKLIGRPEGRTTQTQPGLTMGTPDYISPEQARGRNVDGAADIYSLGVLAFEMTTGQLPFVADNSADMMAMHLSAQPRRPSIVTPGLPPAFDALIARMLEKDATQRPSIGDVRVALEALLLPELLAGDSRAPAPRHRAAAPNHRRRRLIVAGLAALACVALVTRERRQTSLLPSIATLAAMPPPMVPAATTPPVQSEPLPVEPRPAGELIVRPTPSYAIVRVDGERVEVDGGVARQSFEKPGTKALVVWAPGHRAVRLEVAIDGDRTVYVPVRLQRVSSKARPGGGRTVARSNEDFYTVDPWAGDQ